MGSWLDGLLGYKDVLINGVALARRSKLNIVTGATGVDNPTQDRTDLTIAAGGGGGGGEQVIYDVSATPSGIVYSTWATAHAAALALPGNRRILVRNASSVVDATLASGTYNLTNIKLVGDINSSVAVSGGTAPRVPITFSGTAELTGTKLFDFENLQFVWNAGGVAVNTTTHRSDVRLSNTTIDTNGAALILLNVAGAFGSNVVQFLDDTCALFGSANSIDASAPTGTVTIYGGNSANSTPSTVNEVAYADGPSYGTVFGGANVAYRRYKGLVAFVTPTAFAAQQDNYNPQDLHNAHVLGLTSTGAQNISGFAEGDNTTDLQYIINRGAAVISFLNQSASSTANNRIITSTGATLALAAGAWALKFRDVASARWRITLI